MGGVSGRKAKIREKVSEPARKKKEQKPEERVYSVPAHVGQIKTSSGCRFGG